MPNPIVIDMSHHQPDPIDWDQVKAGGTVAIIHKATEGESYVDDKLFERGADAMAAGLSWATYHFLRPAPNITTQIRHYLETIDPRPGERVCLDHEDSGVSLDQLKQAVDFIRQVRPDLQITIYSGHVIEEQLGHECDEYLAENTSLWTAQYVDRPSEVDWVDETWPVPSLWQYSDSESASGVTGFVDGNKWNGTPEALVKWFGPAEVIPPEPAPEPEPEIPTIVADITVTGEVHAQLLINGVLVWSTDDAPAS